MSLEIKEVRLGHIVLSCNLLMAPLAGYTCYPFRMLCYELGAGLCFTEMVSSNGLRYKDKATPKLLYTTPEERIQAVQLLGADPKVMEKTAGSEALAHADIIDINMGCPIPNVVKRGEGCALMLDLKKASAIIRGCKRSGKVITVKCRVGMTAKTMIAGEFAKMCEDSGAELITIHGRYRGMMYSGTPHYDQIEQAKSVVKIPVIANGGIFSTQEAENMMTQTGADGVMIGRYALQNPFVFSELSGKEILKTKYQIIMEQLELTLTHYDEAFAIVYIRKLASYCMKKRRGTKQFKTELYRCGNIVELKRVVKKIFENEGRLQQGR